MAHVTSTNFTVLINGSPSYFFNVSHGFPMYPLLFLLIVEGINLLINEAKDQCKLLGIKFSSTLAITHLISIDDVVLNIYLDMGHMRNDGVISRSLFCFLFHVI